MSADGQIAARILRALLADQLSVSDARRAWPTGRLSQPSAVTYLDYFAEGLDGRGTRDPQVDRMIAELATMLEREGAASWDDKSESWQVDGQAVATTREPADVFTRMVASYLAFHRTRIENALAVGEQGFADVDKIAGQLSGGMRSLFGYDLLEDDERVVLKAPTGRVPRRQLMLMHWRIECVGVLAWALGLLPEIPDASERFDYDAIDALSPETREQATARTQTACLRPTRELMEARARWRQNRLSTEAALQRDPKSSELQLRRSRALERYRALIWLTNVHYGSLAETGFDPQ